MKYLVLFLMNISHGISYIRRLFGSAKPWQADMSQIVPGLYLGGFIEMRPPGIEAVICVAEEDRIPPSIDWYATIRIPRPDFSPAPSPEELQFGVDLIVGLLKLGKATLLQCDQGFHRSAVYAIAYIMFTQHLSAERAQNVVQAKRVLAIPHGFQVAALRAYEAWLGQRNGTKDS